MIELIMIDQKNQIFIYYNRIDYNIYEFYRQDLYNLLKQTLSQNAISWQEYVSQFPPE